ncbi:MAG: glycosyl transferase family 2 [Methylophaga sp.]|nr:MAG: glycosyl transferase family 2 [Methylophaga sp.]
MTILSPLALSADVGIVIVNYKTAGLTIECLRSLDNERTLIRFNVIVVDNDSQDDSFQIISSAVISEGWDDWVSIQESGFNGGFSFGNNVAIRQFLKQKNIPGFIYLLNPDTVIKLGAVTILASFLLAHPKVGIVGSQIEDEKGEAMYSSFKFHSCLTELNRGFSLGLLTKLLTPWLSSNEIPVHAKRTDWVSGASMMIRTSVLESIGGLDEAYFMYYEETDFCLKAARSNWECWYIPKSKVVHFVGQSTGITNSGMEKRMPQYWFDSRRRYFLKNHGVLYTVLADFFWLLGFASWKLRNIIQRKTDNHPPALFRDFLLNSVFMKGIKVSPEKSNIKD